MDSVSSPAVSIILPTYCRPALTARAIESVVAQSFADFELLVIDDGSPEPLIVETFCSDRRVQVLRIAHSGVSAARNYGIEKSRGALIAFLDSDDRWLPEKLGKQVDFLAANPLLPLCHTAERWFRNGIFVNQRLRHAKARGEAFAECLESCRIGPSSVLLRREILDEVGGFDEALPVCEDYDLWLRITARAKIGFIDEVLVEKYAGHGDQLSYSLPAMDRFRIFALCKLLINSHVESVRVEMVKTELYRKLEVLRIGGTKRNSRQLLTVLEELKYCVETATLTIEKARMIVAPDLLEHES